MGGKSSEVLIIESNKDKREDEEATAVTTQRPGTKSQDLGGKRLLDLVLELPHGSPTGMAPWRANVVTPNDRHTLRREGVAHRKGKTSAFGMNY